MGKTNMGNAKWQDSHRMPWPKDYFKLQLPRSESAISEMVDWSAAARHERYQQRKHKMKCQECGEQLGHLRTCSHWVGHAIVPEVFGSTANDICPRCGNLSLPKFDGIATAVMCQNPGCKHIVERTGAK